MKKISVMLVVLVVLSFQLVFAEEGPTPYDTSSLVCIADKAQPWSNDVSVFFSEELLGKMNDLHIRISEISETNKGKGWVEILPRLKQSVEIHSKFYAPDKGSDRPKLVYQSSQKAVKLETARVRFSCPEYFNYVIFY